jgi:phosphoglycolate phosphatase-like HAD superfamily hydrolase
MIHHLMRRFALLDARRVAKVGDTARDMLEGKNAGCGLVIGKHPHPLGTLHTTHTTCTAHQELWPGYRCAERC